MAQCEGIFMREPEGGLTAAQAAAAMGVGKTTARRLFDASAGAAGTLDPVTAARRFDPAWVQAQAARRAAKATRSLAGSLSVAEVAARLRVGKTTVRRWFDRDQPTSGHVIEGGRTEGTERRCNPAWVRALEESLGRPQPPTQ